MPEKVGANGALGQAWAMSAVIPNPKDLGRPARESLRLGP